MDKLTYPSPTDLSDLPGYLETTLQDAEYALRIVVDMDTSTDAGLAHLTEIQAEASKVLKEVEARRVKVVKPVTEFQRRVQEVFRGPKTALDKLKRECTTRLLLAKKDREAAREAALAEVQAAGGHVSDTIVLPTQAKPVEMPRGTGREVIEVELLDPAAVPREYCSPDPKLAKAAYALARKQGKSLEIPGFRIWIRGAGT